MCRPIRQRDASSLWLRPRTCPSKAIAAAGTPGRWRGCPRRLWHAAQVRPIGKGWWGAARQPDSQHAVLLPVLLHMLPDS